MSNNQWKPSRFNARTDSEDGGLIVYNSYTGAIVTYSAEEKLKVEAALAGTEADATGTSADPELTAQLTEMGFLVPASADESRRAQFLFNSINRNDFLHLALLPTEQCNFRCHYCYEDFSKGKMGPDTIQGIKTFVQNQAPYLRHLTVSWFGGEPMAAADVVGELSEFFTALCKERGIEYKAEALTNGYFLKPELFAKSMEWGISHYMITIDGPAEVHDVRRKLMGGGGTYDTIMNNLRAMKETDYEFEISLRTNFDYDNLPAMEQWIDIATREFADDRRFGIYFRPVGCMGGPNDAILPIVAPEEKNDKLWELNRLAMNKGMAMSNLVGNALMPLGSTCYCVKPNSYVIGSDGTIYKCSVALNNEDNKVGKVLADGTFDFDYDKLAFWVTDGDSKDETCGACFFRPACNGNHCKLYRVLNNDRPCSFEKKEIGQALKAVVQNSCM